MLTHAAHARRYAERTIGLGVARDKPVREYRQTVLRGEKMKRWHLVLFLCVFMSGCVSSQIIPKGSVVPSLRTISVVPIECMPLLLHPDTKDNKKAIDALMQSDTRPASASAPSVSGPGISLSRSAAPLINAPVATIRTGASVLAVIGGTGMLLEAASAGKEVPGETAVIEMGQPSEIWMPSVEYAKTAMVKIQQAGSREVRIIGGYIKLPIMDRSITWHMEHWLGPIRRLYNSDVSTVDYAVIGSDHADAILEVGIFSYEYGSERLILQVFVRLVDPRTKQVLGRARNYAASKTGPLAPLLQNDAEGMKRIILQTGNHLLTKCLAEIGLTSE